MSDVARGGAEPSNKVYYFDIAPGRWTGKFDFRVTSFKSLLGAKIPVKDKLLALSMQVFQRVFGQGSITTVMTPHPNEGEAGTCTNDFRIARWFFPLFHSSETYALSPDGTSVHVDAHVTFGPIPFLFREHDTYTATVSDGGFRNLYNIRLLGSRFEGRYVVAPDRLRVESSLVNEWATANEVLIKDSPPGPP